MKGNPVFLMISVVSAFVFISACEKDVDPSQADNNTAPEWLIETDDVYNGGPGKDGIPALENPVFADTSLANYLQDDELVLGIYLNGSPRAYPHPILDRHEIVNDKFGDTHVAVMYCPLTGTGMAWNRELPKGITTFGVSGLLYYTNLLPYDRKTDSYWSQMRLDCVNGELIGQQAELIPVVETTWASWKKMYPNTIVLSDNTGYSRNYDRYPYGNYKTDDDYILFPVNVEDTSIPNKERVHGIIGESRNMAYRFKDFTDGVQVYSARLDDREILVVGSEESNFLLSFYVESSKVYSAVQGAFPVVFSDEEGNSYTVFGDVTAGPLEGLRLESTRSYIGYWLGWDSFYDLDVQNAP